MHGISVAYNGDVTINFHYSVSDSYMNGYVKFNGSDEKVYLTDKKDEKGYYILPISMPAKNEMFAADEGMTELFCLCACAVENLLCGICFQNMPPC